MGGWTPVIEKAPAGWTPVEEAEKPGFGKRFLKASGFEGLVEAAKNPPENWQDLLSAAITPGKEAVGKVTAPAKHLGEIIAAHKAGDKEGMVSAVSKFVDSFIPGSGNAEELASNTVKDVQEGNVPAIAGTATGLGMQLAMLRGGLKEPVPKTPGIAERLYQSALKPSTALPTAKVASVVKTGLEESIPVSAGGVEKLGAMIDDLNTKISKEISSSPATVNKYKVASRLSQTAKEFSQQVNPAKDLSAISESGNEFLGNQPAEIPASTAQAMKQGTYQQIRKSYGQLSNATVESQKALARGIKEELASQIPEIGGLNARESKLIGLDTVLERAVRRIDNQQLMGLGTPVAAGAAGAMTGMSSVGIVTGIVKAIIDDPMVKSRLAIAMSKSGGLRQATARLAAYSAALGNAASKALPADQQTGEQP